MKLEDDLRRALRRKPASAELTARVLDGVRQAERDRSKPAVLTTRQVLLRGLAAAAAIGSLVVGIPRYYESRQKAVEGERVTREVMQALAITSEKLALVQQRLHSTRE